MRMAGSGCGWALGPAWPVIASMAIPNATGPPYRARVVLMCAPPSHAGQLEAGERRPRSESFDLPNHTVAVRGHEKALDHPTPWESTLASSLRGAGLRWAAVRGCVDTPSPAHAGSPRAGPVNRSGRSFVYPCEEGGDRPVSDRCQRP